MKYFKYGAKEIEHLKKRDKKLAKIIGKRGIIKREMTEDPFAALIESIIGQQISGRAAQAVTARFYKLLNGDISPSNIKKLGLEAVRSCGISMRKAAYINAAAEASLNKEIDFKNLHKLKEEEIVKKLSSLDGVGVWTAEMLMLFCLGKKNVLSYGDLGIRRAIMKLHDLKTLSKKEFEKYKEMYSPYGSAASLYLWTIDACPKREKMRET